ncbi:unnamed protein product [Peniophora sp. CBMAI 1063]|nr:unnamed protein product [Peniophora sp. CBMAI 1063]
MARFQSMTAMREQMQTLRRLQEALLFKEDADIAKAAGPDGDEVSNLVRLVEALNVMLRVEFRHLDVRLKLALARLNQSPGGFAA